MRCVVFAAFLAASSCETPQKIATCQLSDLDAEPSTLMYLSSEELAMFETKTCPGVGEAKITDTVSYLRTDSYEEARLRLHVSRWTSARAAAMVAYIILKESLNYNVTLVQTATSDARTYEYLAADNCADLNFELVRKPPIRSPGA